jgi:hypothetical protein
MSHEGKSCEGCYLGVPHERGTCGGYMRQGEVPGWSVFMGRSPRMGGAMMARGVGCPVEREMVTPCEDIPLSHPND